MGMSDDFELAIQMGATKVRVGSAIFGERRTKISTDDDLRRTVPDEIGSFCKSSAAKGDAARGGAIAVLRDMNENGAAASDDAGPMIEIDHSEDVVKPIIPPKRFRAEGERQADRAVIATNRGSSHQPSVFEIA